MSYIALARKYRPKTFSALLGQSHVTKTLENAFHQNKVAQSYLFTGTRGVGKTSLARILAKALRCEALNCQVGEKNYGQPCNACPSCMEIGESNCLDVLEIDGASNNGVDNIRDLRENIRFSPTRGDKKIYIVDEVHMLTGAAFNALLKTLEEPPEHATFIFATTEIQKIPATILSRCQRFDLKRVSKELISKHLHSILSKEGIKAEPKVIELISRKAEGSFRDALSLLDQVIALCGNTLDLKNASEALGIVNQDLLLSIWKSCFTQEPVKALEKLQEAHNFGVSMKAIAISLTELTRDALWIKLGGEKDSLEFLTEEEETLNEVIKNMPLEALQAGFRILTQSVSQIIHSPLPKAQLEFSLTQLSHVSSLDSIHSLLQRLNELEKKQVASPSTTKQIFTPASSYSAPPGSSYSTPSPSTPFPNPSLSTFKEEKSGTTNWEGFVAYASKKSMALGSALEHAFSITPIEEWKKENTKTIHMGLEKKMQYEQLKGKCLELQELLNSFLGEEKTLKLELTKTKTTKKELPVETLDKQNRKTEEKKEAKILKDFNKDKVVIYAKKMFKSNWRTTIKEKTEEK